MNARQELLDALTVERYNGGGWHTPSPDEQPDDDLTTARRRREMAADFDHERTVPRENRAG